MKENSQDNAALRLLARVDHTEMAFVNTEYGSIRKQEAVTYIRNIRRSIRPRHYLRRLIKLVKIVQDATERRACSDSQTASITGYALCRNGGMHCKVKQHLKQAKSN